MTQINRRVVIEGDGSSFESLMEQLNRRSEELYDNLSSSATEHSDSLEEQKRKMDELIRREEEFIRRLRDQKRLQLELRFDQRMSGLEEWERTGEAGRSIERERAEAMRDLNQEYRENRLVTSNLREMRYNDDRFTGDGGDEGGGGSSIFARLGGAGSSIMGGVGAGLGFGALMSIGGMIGSLFSLGTQMEEVRAQSRAMTGGTMGYAERLGLSEIEFTPYAIASNRVRGSSSAARGRDQLASERAFGLDLGSLTSLNEVERYGGNDVITLLTEFLNKANDSGLWEIDKGDYTQLAEKMDFLNRLTQQEAQLFESFTGNRSQEILSVFGKVFNTSGGRLSGRIDTINKGITSPRNEFMQAEVMSAISQDNPDMNLRQVRQLQQQGIFGQGVFSSVLKRLQKRSSSTEDIKLRLSLMFPELASNETALEQLAGANPEDFANISDEELRGKIGKFTAPGIRSRGEAMTSSASRLKAGLDQRVGEAGAPMVGTLSEMAFEIISKIDPEKLGETMKGFFEGVASFGDSVEDFAKAVRKQYSKEKLQEDFQEGWMGKSLGIDSSSVNNQWQDWVDGQPLSPGSNFRRTKDGRVVGKPMGAKPSGITKTQKQYTQAELDTINAKNERYSEWSKQNFSGQMSQSERDSIFGPGGVFETQSLTDSINRLNNSIIQLQPPSNNLNNAAPSGYKRR